MFNQIKKDTLEARKASSNAAGLLVTLQSEIAMKAKNDGNREPNDQDCVKVVQNFLKSALETRDILDTRGLDTAQPDLEIGILQSYLPKTLTEEETAKAVNDLVAETGASGMQDMGKVMGALKSKYGTTIDMKLASQLFKSL